MTTVNQLFQFHKLNPDGIKKAEEIAATFNRLLWDLEHMCPTSTREFSITRTKLEEACFYAKKSMAMDPANQLKGGE